MWRKNQNKKFLKIQIKNLSKLCLFMNVCVQQICFICNREFVDKMQVVILAKTMSLTTSKGGYQSKTQADDDSLRFQNKTSGINKMLFISFTLFNESSDSFLYDTIWISLKSHWFKWTAKVTKQNVLLRTQKIGSSKFCIKATMNWS